MQLQLRAWACAAGGVAAGALRFDLAIEARKSNAAAEELEEEHMKRGSQSAAVGNSNLRSSDA